MSTELISSKMSTNSTTVSTFTSKNIVISYQDSDFTSCLLYKMWYYKPPNTNDLSFTRFKKQIHSMLNKLFINYLIDKNCIYLSFIYMYKIHNFYHNIASDSIDSGNETHYSNSEIYKLYTICLMLSQKWLCDTSSKISTWSFVSKISSFELIFIETKILDILDFKLNVSLTEFEYWESKCKLRYIEYITRRNKTERIACHSYNESLPSLSNNVFLEKNIL